ncbi:hypothetical protein KJ682_06695, partial [bacterium]|nr:hypothetical protein [bacterium]
MVGESVTLLQSFLCAPRDWCWDDHRQETVALEPNQRRQAKKSGQGAGGVPAGRSGEVIEQQGDVLFQVLGAPGFDLGEEHGD